jgi:hypothetical protein
MNAESLEGEQYLRFAALQRLLLVPLDNQAAKNTRKRAKGLGF